MKEKSAQSIFLKIINQFEIYIGTGIFLFLGVILTINVIGRYVFGYSFSWIEELSVIFLIALVYCGSAGAVRDRKFLRIEALVESLPFKWKRGFLIFDTVVQAGWLIFIFFPLMSIVRDIAKRGGVTSILRIPKIYPYGIIVVFLVLIVIRSVQEVIVLLHEEEKTLGKTKPSFDLDAIAAEGERLREASAKANAAANQPGKKEEKAK